MAWIARLLLAAVLLFAALPKAMDPNAFAESIANYRMLPGAWVGPVALAMIGLETAVALGLLVPAVAQGAALLATGLFASFSGAMIQALVRGIDIDCGCFGKGTSPVSPWTIARSALFATAAAFVLWEQRRRRRGGQGRQVRP
ncbi:MAG: hypothetical protein KC416_08910 [Myxococcales bacterium]|nr:hypothetical protein [Myxococcales bacterium]